MAEEQCSMEDGYFVCVKKAALKQPEILTALLADCASFQGDVGKLSFLPGVTVPNEIPTSPAFIAKDGKDFTMTPGGWMPFCPVLYGATGLLPDQQKLLNIGGMFESYTTLTTDEILESATIAHSLISDDKGKRWSHLSRISTTNQLSKEDENALFAIFPHVEENKHHEYVIYMINTLHGAASAALNEILIATKKTLTLNLMENVLPYCENVDPDGLQAVLVPYYSEYGVAGSTSLSNKTYCNLLGDLSEQSLSTFSDLGDPIQGPKIPFVANTCASDVYKMFPGGIHGVDNGQDILELCRALVLGVPGRETTASGEMEAERFNMKSPEDPNEISRPGIDVSTFICLATLYTARMPEEEDMLGSAPRHAHILNMLERMRTLREERSADSQDDDKILWWLMKLIDDVHASILYTYMDTAAAIHRLDYENLVLGKYNEIKGLQSFVDKTYQRPLVTMPNADPLVRLWVAVGGDFVMYAALVQAMERDVWRFKADTELHIETSMTTPLSCLCTNQTSCIHRMVKDWCGYTQVDKPEQGNKCTKRPSASTSHKGLLMRLRRKRKADGAAKTIDKMPHDSLFLGTLRCASSYDISFSPVGNTNLKPQDGAMYKTEKNDSTEQFKNHRSLSVIINGILKEVSLGMEEENESLYQNGIPAGDIAMKTSMAKMGDEKRNNLLLGTSPHVLFENGKGSWELGKQAPIYRTLDSGKRYASLKLEVVEVTKTAANALLDKIISAMRLIHKRCAEVKNKAQTPLGTDQMWKPMLRGDPNLNQYDAMHAPLLAATMTNILRPVVTALRAKGMLFQSTSCFMRDFPYYDRTKLDDVFGDGGSVQYGMNGKFLANKPQISVFTHSKPPTCIPCLWKGTGNQRMAIDTCRVKGVCKGKDVANPWCKKNSNQKSFEPAEHTQSQNIQATDGLMVNEDSTVRSQRQLLAKPFLFEIEEDGELAYMEGLQGMEDVALWKEGPQPSSWMEGVVLGAILDVLNKCPDLTKVLAIVWKTLGELSKWRYVCKALDFLASVYSPSRFFIPGNDQGLSVFKYLLVHLNVCRSFNLETFYSKPIYTACGFLGPCTKTGRPMNFVFNYDLLSAYDAPYVTLPMDYKLYGNLLKSKVFGGPCITKAVVTQSGILSSMPSSMFSNKTTVPYFILITPCVPFRERNSEDKTLAMLTALSFEQILSRLHSEKMANVVARACGYDNLQCAASAESSELTKKLSCLSISTKEAKHITELLKDMVNTSVEESITEDGILMSWDENYELSEVGPNEDTSMHHANVDDLISNYK